LRAMPHFELSPNAPLYDPTKPIACTIDAADIPEHVARLERIRSQLTRIDRTAFGVVLVLPDSDSNASDVEQLAVEEKRCCEFWGFQLVRAGGVMLRWDGPPEATAWMDALVEYFEGRTPIGGLFGRF
jgi:hypothetical protein